ncbi:MAG TPA: hypothetical protein VJ111_13780 [Chitinophagaceae bacterium]|nr:hypothetical protein [Chitinophagaceae bacterium]
MRLLLFSLIAIPFFSSAQVNRSANELARERVREYIVTMVFKDQPYKPVSYGELKSYKRNRSEIEWSIEHKFEIEETQLVSEKKVVVRKPQWFWFYLDKKLKVILAESFQQN